jgi:hypothetical protein
MVKAEVGWQVVSSKQLQVDSIVGSRGDAAALGNKDRGDGMYPTVPGRI